MKSPISRGRSPGRAVSVLVTDGEQRSALAAVRSLGRAGHRVHVCSVRRRSLAGTSRYASRAAVVADPLEQPDRYSRDILDLLRRWEIDLLLPISEASLLSILKNEEVIREAIIPVPEYETFRRVCDKDWVGQVAAGIGIKIPAQRVLADPIENAELKSEKLQFPLVVRPARSVVGTDMKRVKTGVSYARNRDALDIALNALSPEAYPVLLQERIVGPGAGVFLLRWQGEMLASFFHRRIREKPPSGGVSVYRESAPPDPALLDLSSKLLSELDWEGVAMIEYKVDAATGSPHLMEINGRLWGSLQLAIDSGVDFPQLLVAAALGHRPSPVHSYQFGVRSRWFWGDVDHLIARLRYPSERLALPPDAPTRWRAVADFMAGFRPENRGEILRADDPMPALRETIDWVRNR